MALRRFYVEPDLLRETSIVLTGDIVHHIRDVVRFGVGDRFELLGGDGLAVLVEITRSEPRALTCQRLSERTLSVPAGPRIHLVLSLPKLPKVDWIIEKSVELGAWSLHPVVSDHSFLRKLSEISPARVARWNKLVLAATQQSGRGDLLEIHAPMKLEALLGSINLSSKCVGLFPYEGEAALGLSQALEAALEGRPDELWLFVGSEGGFSAREVELFRKKGLPPVGMGEQILRVETACVAALSIIKYACRAFG